MFWVMLVAASVNYLLAQALVFLGFLSLARSVARSTKRLCQYALGVLHSVHTKIP